MADAAAVAPAPEAAPEANPGAWGHIKALLQRMMMFYLFSTALKAFTGGSGPAATNATVKAAVGTYPPASNLFHNGQLYDLFIYLDESPSQFTNFDKGHLFAKKSGLVYGDWTAGDDGDGSFVFTKTFPTPEVLQRNQSIFLHTFVVKDGQSPNPRDKNYVKREVIYKAKQLNKYRKKYYKKTVNLLTGVSEQSDEDLKKAEQMKFEILNYWHPNITINILTDQTALKKGEVPAPLDTEVQFSPSSLNYYPVVYYNTYWNLVRDYQPINETVKEVNLTITFQPISLFKFQMYASQDMKPKWSQVLQMDQEEEDQDALKTAFLETNPILLAVTGIVSLLHTALEFLAFKNDIQFWNSRKDLVGLSVRSVLFNIFQSLIVFLYVCDNDTNFVVKVSVGIGLLIECWKIPKVLDVKIDRENKLFGVIPRIHFQDKGSYVESETKVYDQMAFKYLSWVLFPLLVGYAVYSIIYVEQKGWYSWVLNMLYGYLLMFGFITMTPQLFINYKLKSVAHLPWRMLTYKFVNTFIDDLFAFVIKMPWLYRIGCFRDDLIFLVYLYQRWIYRVDPTRVNEYGTSLERENGTDPTTAIEDKKDEPNTSAAAETKKDK